MEIYRTLLLVVSLSVLGQSMDCSCENPSWCLPLNTASAPYEVYGFHYSSGYTSSFNWSIITTLALVGDIPAQTVCEAHSYGVRVVQVNYFPNEQLNNATFRTEYTENLVSSVESSGGDGVNLDIEGCTDDQKEGLVLLVQEVVQAFHSRIPGSQVTLDLGISPQSNYDFLKLSQTADFVVLMAYDMGHSSYGSPNCPFWGVFEGTTQYIWDGVAENKMVVGLPWYGYDYICKETSPQTTSCHSNASVQAVDYNQIAPLLANSPTGRLWDWEEQTPYFNYVASDGSVHQVWYDDSESIGRKAYFVKKLGLRGIGVWTADYVTGSNDVTSMWNALEGSLDL